MERKVNITPIRSITMRIQSRLHILCRDYVPIMLPSLCFDRDSPRDVLFRRQAREAH
jgi:hypothetical protein